MSFHEVRFPLRVGFGARGGPMRRTEVVTLASGREERNAVWAQARRRFDVGGAIRSLDDLAAVTTFFEARMGRLYGFRFRDPMDWRTSLPSAAVTAQDQLLGHGDGAATRFQLVKHYADAAGATTRALRKPVEGSVRVSVGGTELAGEAFSVDLTTGEVDLAIAPGPGLRVEAGCQFDTPVRFDSDVLEASLEGFAAGRVLSVPLIELLV